MEPPLVSCLTDEESGDEDEGGEFEHLSGNQLLAPAELVFDAGRVGGPADDSEINLISVPDGEISPMQPTVPQPSTSATSVMVGHSDRLLRLSHEWLKEEAANRQSVRYLQGVITNRTKNNNFPVENYEMFKGMTPAQILELFLSDSVIDLLVRESNSYASYRFSENPTIKSEEMKCFIGILILSSYNILPSKRHYWEKAEDVRNEMVCKAMRRSRFFTIMKHFHCADNNQLDRSDKFTKLRPLLKLIQENCLNHFVPVRDLNYDESMIKYFGKHGSKQFIRGKPIRFGFKAWCLNTSEGYCVNFDLYQGKDTTIPDHHAKHFGKASAPFVKLIEQLDETKQVLPYHFYFDNLFTSPNLFTFLRFCGYEATGTIRANRVPKESVRAASAPNSRLRSGRVQKKKLTYRKVFPEILSPCHLKVRGNFCSGIERKSGLFFLRWLDSGIVTVSSTAHGIQPIKPVKRYSKQQRRNVLIPRPSIISNYNKYMGGTDQMDWNVYKYRTSIRGKKWTWNIITWLLDVVINNAWLMYRHHNIKTAQLDFRRAVVEYYLTAYGTPSMRPGPSGAPLALTTRVTEDIRFDDKGHYVVSTDAGKRRRCAYEHCDSKVRTMCRKCNVGLCVPHFYIFHSK